MDVETEKALLNKMDIIIYPRHIHESIIAQMETCAIAKAMNGKYIYYTTIGDSDFAKIYQSYEKCFK